MPRPAKVPQHPQLIGRRPSPKEITKQALGQIVHLPISALEDRAIARQDMLAVESPPADHITPVQLPNLGVGVAPVVVVNEYAGGLGQLEARLIRPVDEICVLGCRDSGSWTKPCVKPANSLGNFSPKCHVTAKNQRKHLSR